MFQKHRGYQDLNGLVFFQDGERMFFFFWVVGCWIVWMGFSYWWGFFWGYGEVLVFVVGGSGLGELVVAG
jgi:hypothetical protein